MAVVKRFAGVFPLAGAATAAVALAGVALFTVAEAGCADPGQYVERNGQMELIGGCVDTHKLQPAPLKQGSHLPAEPAALWP